MLYKQNLHQHSRYCDGADTPKEIIEHAIKKLLYKIKDLVTDKAFFIFIFLKP